MDDVKLKKDLHMLQPSPVPRSSTPTLPIAGSAAAPAVSTSAASSASLLPPRSAHETSISPVVPGSSPSPVSHDVALVPMTTSPPPLPTMEATHSHISQQRKLLSPYTGQLAHYIVTLRERNVLSATVTYLILSVDD